MDGEIKIPTTVKLSTLLIAILLATGMGILYDVHTAMIKEEAMQKGREILLEEIETSVPKLIEKSRTEGIQICQQELIKRCTSTPEKQLVINCKVPTTTTVPVTTTTLEVA